MDRRAFVAAAGVVAGTVVSGKAISESKHKGHMKSKKRSKVVEDLIEETEECLQEGRECLAHCLDSLNGGDTSLVSCQQSVMNMMASVDALNQVAVYGTYKAESMKRLVEACQAFCEDCIIECEKHVKHHKVCRDCAKACEECVKACKSYLKTI